MNEKKKTNRTAIYVTAMILLFLLIAGSIGLVTWAILKTNMKVGGDINFKGSGNVLATISDGTITNGTGTPITTDGVMRGFIIDQEYGENAEILNTWAGLSLTFEENATTGYAEELRITYTITNNADLTLIITTQTAREENYEIKNATEVFSAKKGGEVVEDAFNVRLAKNEVAEFTITFTPEANKEATVTGFGYQINLVNEKPAA